MIESAKITFSRIGFHSSQGDHGVIWMPRVALTIQGRKHAKTGYLPGKDRLDRFSKKDYQGLCILREYIVVVTKNEYIVVDEQTEERASLDPKEIGRIVGVQDEGFLSVKDDYLRLHDITGAVIAERALTEADHKILKEQEKR